MSNLSIFPEDEYNLRLMQAVHPRDRVNPVPAEMYNLVVIGAGTAGLVCAAAAQGLGAKTALIERAFMGGDCLNFGCVPSKSIIASGNAAQRIRDAANWGLTPQTRAPFPAGDALRRMREIRARISGHDSVARFSELGVDVFLGHGEFSGPNSIRMGAGELRFRKAVVATGARAVEPRFSGAADVKCLTNETVFSLTELPRRLMVMGGGPIGCELAQAFCRLGCETHLLHKNSRLLDKEDPEASAILLETFVREGIMVHLGAEIISAHEEPGGKVLDIRVGTEARSVTCDEILVAVGRAPNIDGMNLEAAGIEYDRAGIKVDDFLRTSNNDVYAAGDVCMKHKFTHAADQAARIVIRNALFHGRARLSRSVIPWCTYTDPEIAHAGVYEGAEDSQGRAVDTVRVDASMCDRAVTDGTPEGFIKVHLRKGKDEILGATIVSPHAGDLIGYISAAMTTGLRLSAFARTVFPYPTHSELLKKAADAHSRSRLTPKIRSLLRWWFEWKR